MEAVARAEMGLLPLGKEENLQVLSPGRTVLSLTFEHRHPPVPGPARPGEAGFSAFAGLLGSSPAAGW